MKPSMQKKLAALSERIQELNTLLSSESITNDMDQYRKITKEHADITPIVDEYLAKYSSTIGVISACSLVILRY